MSRIAIVMDNSVKYIELLLNIWNAGHCAVLIDWHIPLDAICKMLIETNVEICYIEQSLYAPICSEYRNIQFILINENKEMVQIVPKEVMQLYSDNYSKEDALILFSSGTTGKAKGIRLSHYAIQTNADAIIQYMEPTPQDSIYIVKSLTHSSTIVGECLIALKSGMRIILSPGLITPRKIIKTISQADCTIICVNPTLLRLLTLDSTACAGICMPNLRRIYVSGSILHSNVLEQAKVCFPDIPVLNVYGLTELGPRVCAQRTQQDGASGSVGRPIDGVEVRIINHDGSLSPVMQKGLIHVKSPSVFSGYVNEYHHRESLMPGWTNTGDMGFMDTQGNVYIAGRSDTMILNASHNVFPEEIELVVNSCPGVQESLVFGADDVLTGQRLICFYISNQDPGSEALHKLCAKKLPSYEIPQRFILVKYLPKTLNGKLSRLEAISLYEEEFKNASQCNHTGI